MSKTSEPREAADDIAQAILQGVDARQGRHAAGTGTKTEKWICAATVAADKDRPELGVRMTAEDEAGNLDVLKSPPKLARLIAAKLIEGADIAERQLIEQRDRESHVRSVNALVQHQGGEPLTQRERADIARAWSRGSSTAETSAFVVQYVRGKMAQQSQGRVL